MKDVFAKRFFVLLAAVLALGMGGCSGLGEMDGSPDWTSLHLGSSWVAAITGDTLFQTDVTVTNHESSGYDVLVRLTDGEAMLILQDAVTLAPGASHTFHDVPGGGYIIQAKSADDVPREFTLTYSD